MKSAYVILIAIALVPLIASITYLGYQRSLIVEVKEIEMALEVSTIYGFNVNSSRLNLGTLPQGGHAYRDFTVVNNGESTQNIELAVSGPMKDWTTLSYERFVLGPGMNQTVQANVHVPGNAEMKEYLSTIYVIYKKAHR